MTRPLIAFAIVAALATAAGAQDIRRWRTPDGKLYFGSAPPPGSTLIDSARARPTAQPSPQPSAPQPTARTEPMTRPQATPRPTASAADAPTARAQPSAVPTATAPPARTAAPLAPPDGWVRKGSCSDIVEIRDTRPTIDFEADRVVVRGEVVVLAGGRVKDLVICLSESCTPVAEGRVLTEGDTARFTVSTPRNRPTGLTVECSVREPR